MTLSPSLRALRAHFAATPRPGAHPHQRLFVVRVGLLLVACTAASFGPSRAAHGQDAQPPASAAASDDGLYVIVEATQRPLDGLLVLPPACGPQKTWCETLEAVVHNDMRLSGVVRALQPGPAVRNAIQRFAVPNLEIALDRARAADVTWAVGLWARKSKTQAESIEVHIQMIDARDGHAVELGRHAIVSGPANQLRRLGHRVANVIFGALSGVMGSFDGQLYYSSPAPGVDRAIWLADADGYNARMIVADKGVHMLPRPTSDLGVAYVSFRTDLPSLFRIDGPGVDALFAVASDHTTPASAQRSPFAVATARATAIAAGASRAQLKAIAASRNKSAGSAADPGAAPSKPGPPQPFATSEELQFRTAASGPSGQVVATINDGDQADLWLLDDRGRPLKNLTQHESDDLDPSWSTDGRQIAFVSNRSGTPQVYVMNADGSGVQRMTWAGPYNTGPDFGADGRIVYSGLRGKAVDILTVDAQKQMQRLTPGRGKRSLEPTWAPCGRRVIYVSDEDGAGTRLFFASHDGAMREPLALPPGRYYTPAWRRAPGVRPEAFRP